VKRERGKGREATLYPSENQSGVQRKYTKTPSDNKNIFWTQEVFFGMPSALVDGEFYS
jgi:hypothetical protein